MGMFLNPTASVPSTVQLDNVPLAGVPKTGATNVGLDVKAVVCVVASLNVIDGDEPDITVVILCS